MRAYKVYVGSVILMFLTKVDDGLAKHGTEVYVKLRHEGGRGVELLQGL